MKASPTGSASGATATSRSRRCEELQREDARPGPARGRRPDRRLRDEQAEANDDLAPLVADERLVRARRPAREARRGGAEAGCRVKAKAVKKLDPAGDARPTTPRGSSGPAARAGRPSPRRRSSAVEITAQHDLRIAAKRLRYVLELTGFCLGRPADTALRRARELQDILGEMHDCDVMLPRVREHVASLQDRDAEAVRAQAGPMDRTSTRACRRCAEPARLRGLDVLAVHLAARRRAHLRPLRRVLAPPGGDSAPGLGSRTRADAQLERSRQMPARPPRRPRRRRGRSREGGRRRAARPPSEPRRR